MRTNLTPWDEAIFAGIKAVNQNNRTCGLPEKAARLLGDMEVCLASGDGLSPQSAFRASSDRVVERVVSLLGLKGGVKGNSKIYMKVSVESNPFSIDELWFTLEGGRDAE